MAEEEAEQDRGRVTLAASAGQCDFGDAFPADAPFFASGFLIVSFLRGEMVYLVGQERESDPSACTTFSGIRCSKQRETIWETAIREMREETLGCIHLSSLRVVGITFRRGEDIPNPYVLYIATIPTGILSTVLRKFSSSRAALLRGDLDRAPYFITRAVKHSTRSLSFTLFPFLEMKGLVVIRARDLTVLMQSFGSFPFERAHFHEELQHYLEHHTDDIEHLILANQTHPTWMRAEDP